ncbi:MAG TPA: catalase family peroxidase [Rhizomicrobium sp.]|jgi:catalase
MPQEKPDYSLSGLFELRTIAKLAGIGAVAALFAGAFAWTGGWFSPASLNQARMIDGFQVVNGLHPGFRRNHAKGVCLSGWFDSNGNGARLSRARLFAPGRTPVFGRFALAGGMPRSADKPATVRSMALNFALADGEVWRTGMNDIPVFPVRDPQAFYDQMFAARVDPATGKPNPAAVKTFLAAHPESAAAGALIKAEPMSSGFANARYNSLNAFRFIAADGTSTSVRWSMVPVDSFAPAPAEGETDPNYLFSNLSSRLEKGPVLWHLVITVGQAEDPTNDATVPWPKERERIEVGTLTVTALQTEADGNCRDVNFDPLVLPSGIAASDDPLLSARSAAYSVSFTRRAREAKSPSAVQIGKGA